MAKKASCKHSVSASALASTKTIKKPLVRKPRTAGAFDIAWTRKPLWNLFEHGITQGFIDTWLEDRETARLKYMIGYQSYGFVAHLQVGTIFHDTLAEVTTDKKKNKSALVEKRLNEKRKALAKETGPLTPDERYEEELRFGQIEILMKRYMEHWGEWDSENRWLAREDVFTTYVPITLDGISYAVPITGRLDGLFEKSNKLYVHETKTKKQVDAGGLQQSLHLDVQSMLYLYMASKHHGPGTEDNLKIGGFLYDVIRKPSISPTKKETLQQYLDRLYDDIGQRPDFYYFRWPINVTTTRLNIWYETVLKPILRSILQWFLGFYEKNTPVEATTDPANLLPSPLDNPHHYFNPRSLFNRYGRSDFFDYFVSGNDSGFGFREHPFPELLD